MTTQIDAPPQLAVTLSPRQDDFITACQTTRYMALAGGVGSGKTYVGALRSIQCIDQFEGDGMIVAPTYKMLGDVTTKQITDFLDQLHWPYVHLKQDEILKIFGRRIFLRSAEKPDRLRGPNISWIWIDEAALCYELAWRVLIGRARIGDSRIHLTTTPAGLNWVYDRFVDSPHENYGLIHISTRENKYLRKDFVEDLEQDYTNEYAAQEIDGQFVAFEGLVYNEFRRNPPFVDEFELVDSWQKVRAVDYGYTNPFVCLFGALDEDKNLYIYNEHYARRLLIKQHAEHILSIDGGAFSWTVADWDAQDNAELISNGIPTQRAHKEVTLGIQAVKARMKVQPNGRPRLIIHPRCVNLIKELGMYRWAQQKEGVNAKEEPVKENDHACDALRYMVMEIDRGGFVII